MSKKSLVFAALLAAISAPGLSGASILYGIEFSSGTGFYQVNQATGAITLIGNTGNPATGDLTSDQSSTIWSVDMNNNALLTINPATGAVSSTTPLMAPTGAPVTIVSLAWDPLNHNLYGNTAVGFGNTVNDQLYQIDPTSGMTSFIGTIGFNAVYALGFDQSGTLFGISNVSADLLTINIGSGAGTLVAPVTLSSAFDLAFRPEDNTMFVADSVGGTESLYTMNPTTGAASLVGPYGSATNVVGLAFIAPEPGTVGLLLSGLALVAWKARKRARG